MSGANLFAQGSLAASGSLSVQGPATFGSTIRIGNVTYTFPASDGTASGKVLKTDSAGTLSWSEDNNTIGLAAAEAEGMFVDQGGDTMTGALTIANSAGLNASGAILTNGNLTINSDNGAADATLTFGNDAGAETIKFNDTTSQFELTDDVSITGTLGATGNITGSGNLSIDGALGVEGAATFGSTIASTGTGTFGKIKISNTDPELRLIDTGNNEYARFVKTDTTNYAYQYNRTNKVPTANFYALDLATDDYVDLDAYRTNYYALTSGTINFWIKTTATSARLFFLGRPIYANDGFKIDIVSSRLVWQIYNSNSVKMNWSSTNTINDGNWHMVTLRGGTAGNSIWMDGAAMPGTYSSGNSSTTSWLNDISGGVSKMDIGAGWVYNASLGAYFSGSLDDFAFWNNQLSDANVDYLYNSGNGIYIETTDGNVGTGLFGLYRFDEGTGTAIVDAKSAQNGTATNFESNEWGTAKIVGANVVGEYLVWSSRDGVNAGESNIDTFGDPSGRTIVEGLTTRFNIAGVEKAQINASGNVGIGTTDPETMLEVAGTMSGSTLQAQDLLNSSGALVVEGASRIHGTASFSGTASGATLHAESLLSSSGALSVDGAAAFDGGLTFGDTIGDAITVNAGTWTYANDTNFALSGGINGLSFDTSTLSIDAENDRVGIGTTSPGYVLDVQHASDKINSKNGYLTNGADYAEYFPNEEHILEGSLVGINMETGKVRRYRAGDEYIGIASDGHGFVGNGNRSIENDPHFTLVGLLGQLTVRPEEVNIRGRIVSTRDDKRIGLLLQNGKVLLR